MEDIKKEELRPNKEELAALFYKAVSRRPLLDVVQTAEETVFWEKSFSNANDITLYSWRNDWLKNLKGNLAQFGHFNREHSVKVFANELIKDAVILVGAGPSLQYNIEYLKLAKDKGIKIIASHHSLMYLADLGIKPDFVCVLDAGAMWDDYFAFDKMDCSDVPLLADQVSNTGQLKKWKGPVYFFRSAHPENSAVGKILTMELDRIIAPEKSGSIIEVGGHVMGAMTSLARGVMACNTILFAGADYCFNPQGKFYPFDHKIDKTVVVKDHMDLDIEAPAPPAPEGEIIDIFGNRAVTTGAYLGFKNVMDIGIKINKINSIQTGSDLEFINASEGGALGSLDGGNSRYMSYLRLEDAIHYASNKLETNKKKESEKK